MAEKPVIFVSMSFDKKDKNLIETIINGLLAPYFTIKRLGSFDPNAPPEAARRAINESEAFIAIATRKYPIGTNKWKTHDWIMTEIGIAYGNGKKPLALCEEGVELGGIPNFVTTIGYFKRGNILQKLSEFREQIENEANKLKNEKITKIEAWHQTRDAIQKVFDTAAVYVHGVVEDFSTLDKFEESLSRLNKDVEFKLICSSYGANIDTLQEEVAKTPCNVKEVRFINPSSIGRVRMLFNEKVGLFVIHARGEEYFGIKTESTQELESHFEKLLTESSPNKESGRILGKFCRINRDALASLVTWSIKDLSDIPENERFIYILSSRFTLFNDEGLQKALVAMSKGSCKIKFILSKKSLDRETYTESMSEIINKTLCDCSSVSRGILRADSSFPIERRRMIITNKIALDLLDFGSKKDYYYSTIQDKDDINILKQDFEKLPVEKEATSKK